MIPARSTDLHNFGNIFVGQAGFFRQARHRHGLDQNTALFHLLLQLLAANRFLRLRARHRSPGPMHRRPKRVAHRSICPHEQIRAGFHRTAADDRLARLPKRVRQFRTPRPKRPGRSFAMHDQLPFCIPFDLGDIMRHVIHQLHPQCFGRLAEDRREGFANLMRDHLPIGKGACSRRNSWRKNSPAPREIETAHRPTADPSR